MDKVQIINITVLSSQDFEMVQHLSNIHGTTWSHIAARALNEWLKLNFVKKLNDINKQNKFLKNLKMMQS